MIEPIPSSVGVWCDAWREKGRMCWSGEPMGGQAVGGEDNCKRDSY